MPSNNSRARRTQRRLRAAERMYHTAEVLSAEGCPDEATAVYREALRLEAVSDAKHTA